MNTTRILEEVRREHGAEGLEAIGHPEVYPGFYEVTRGGIKMIMHNGRFNASKLCNRKKPFYNWKVLSSTDDNIAAVSSCTGIPVHDLMIDIENVPNDFRGQCGKLATRCFLYIHKLKNYVSRL